MNGPEIESRWGESSPEAHLASCTMGTVSILGVEQPGMVVTTYTLLAPGF
jgi:hypothetical protein